MSSWKGNLVRTLVLGFSIHESVSAAHLFAWYSGSAFGLGCSSGTSTVAPSSLDSPGHAPLASVRQTEQTLKKKKKKRANPFSRRGQPQRDAPITLTYEKSPAGSLQFRCICHELSSREPRYILDFTEQTAEKTLFSAAVLKGKAGILMMALLSSFFKSFICHACCVSFTFCLFFEVLMFNSHRSTGGGIAGGRGFDENQHIWWKK